MGGVGDEFLHDLADFGELVHETHLVVETTGGVDDDDVGILGQRALEGVVGHRGGVGPHALLHDGHLDAVGPKHELLDGGGAEGVGSAEHDFFACLLVAVGEFGDGGGLAYAVDTHDEDDVGVMGQGGVEIGGEVALRLTQELSHLGAEDGVELGGGDIAVAFDAFLQVVDNLEGGVDTHVGGDERFLQVVEDVVVDGGFAEDGLGELLEKASLGFGQTLVEGLLFLFFAFAAEIEKSHIIQF